MRFANSLMTTYFDGTDGGQTEPCVVILRDDELVIEYRRNGLASSYKGALQQDLYQLRYWPEIEGFTGIASLRWSEPKLMEGVWIEQEGGAPSTGTWEIELRE